MSRSFIAAEASGNTEVIQINDGAQVTVNFDQINDTMRLLGWKTAILDTLAAYKHFLGQYQSWAATPMPE